MPILFKIFRFLFVLLILPFPTFTEKFDGREVIEVNLRIFGTIFDQNQNKYQNCGGTLISTRHVLTGAHCFFDIDHVCKPEYSGKLTDSLAKNYFDKNATKKPFDLEQTIVDLDGLCLPNTICNVKKEKKCACLTPERTRQVRVNRVFIPTSFVRSHCDEGDIAVLELTEAVAVRKVGIAQWQTPINNPLFASGYGYNPIPMHLERNKDQLRTVNVSVLPHNKCPEEHRQPDTICADELAVDQNVCVGDSGAGLRDEKANIFGIVLSGTKCDRMANDDAQHVAVFKRKYAGALYTNATYYLPFICSVAGQKMVVGCEPNDVKRAKEQPHFKIARNGNISGKVADFEVLQESASSESVESQESEESKSTESQELSE